jgi:glycosyltransferase involved in cell wall biosynthesis
MTGPDVKPTRILSVIARLNVGGPAIHAIILARLLGERGYETRLIRGREGPREGSMDALAKQYGVTPMSLPTLKRSIGLSDVVALVFLIRQIRAWQPQILHTHTAKAGALGRLAALLAAGRRPPVVVHTFHGHVLNGYFSRRMSAVFTAIERLLARFTTCLIAVSEEVRADLIRLRVAPAERIVVVPLGFDFSGFDVSKKERRQRRDAFRRSLGIPIDARVVSLVGRLERIKRVDRFLRVATLIDDPAETWFLVVGDGALREDLQESPEAGRLGSRLVWAGLRDDMSDVYFASDIVAITSDNEGTAVSAIEAQAAALPVVTTHVGGMAAIVRDGETGVLVDPRDEVAFARALKQLLIDTELARRFGEKGAEHSRAKFSIDRLLADLDRLLMRLLFEATGLKTPLPPARGPVQPSILPEPRRRPPIR